MTIEPHGYFKADPFGWMDCEETDEGAVPLYERSVIEKLEAQLADARREAAEAQAHERFVTEKLTLAAIEQAVAPYREDACRFRAMKRLAVDQGDTAEELNAVADQLIAQQAEEDAARKSGAL